MKEIIFFIGSPRKKGNTAEMAQYFIKHLNGQFNCEKVNLSGIGIKPCVDCRACKTGKLTCTVKDAMTEIYPKIDKADYIVFATPIYWFGPSAQMKTLIDRLRPYYGNKKLAGKKMILILPAGSGPGDCDLTIDMFKRIVQALNMTYVGEITATAYDVGDVLQDQNALIHIDEMADSLI